MDRQAPRERQDGDTRFRSRHALGLSYRTSYLKPKKRYGERASKLMDRLGATDWAEPPIRPKNSKRPTNPALAVHCRAWEVCSVTGKLVSTHDDGYGFGWPGAPAAMDDL